MGQTGPVLPDQRATAQHSPLPSPAPSFPTLRGCFLHTQRWKRDQEKHQNQVCRQNPNMVIFFPSPFEIRAARGISTVAVAGFYTITSQVPTIIVSCLSFTIGEVPLKVESADIPMAAQTLALGVLSRNSSEQNVAGLKGRTEAAHHGWEEG